MPDAELPPRPFAGVRILDLAAPVSAYCARVLAGVRRRRPAPRTRRAPGVDARPIHAPRGSTRGTPRAAGGSRSTSPTTMPTAARRAGRDVDVVIASPTAATPVAGFVDDRPGSAGAAPSVVTCLLTPFGATGPLRNWRATPMTAHAMSGLMYAVGPEAGPPLSMPGSPAVGRGRRSVPRSASPPRCSERPRVGGQVLDIAAHEVLASQDDIIHRFSVAGLVMQRRAQLRPAAERDVGRGRRDRSTSPSTRRGTGMRSSRRWARRRS